MIDKGEKGKPAHRIGLAFTLAPGLVVILACVASYRLNSRNLYAISEAYCEKSSQDAAAGIDALLTPVTGILGVAAGLASDDPSYFRSERSRGYLHDILLASGQIDAVYASFEDGYHRVVTRVDEDRRNNDPQIPANARWHSSYIDKFVPGRKRVRHRTFFADWPDVVKTYDVQTDVDVRALPHYKQAQQTRAVVFSDPLINPDTGAPIVVIGYPILQAGRFMGFMAANITFGLLAKYLDDHKASPNSVSMIVDSFGRVLAHPDLKKCVRKAGGEIVFATLDGFSDENVREAAVQRAKQGRDRLIYKSGQPPVEYAATFTPFPQNFGKKWEILTITPTDDYLSSVKNHNLRLLGIIAAAICAELALFASLAKRFAGEPVS
jgi:hypothetical protein